jgi:hypothetical protein
MSDQRKRREPIEESESIQSHLADSDSSSEEGEGSYDGENASLEQNYGQGTYSP